MHKCDLFFDLTGLRDVHLRATFAVSLLVDNAYVWFMSQNYTLGSPTGLDWPTLKSDLLAHFRPVDYGY